MNNEDVLKKKIADLEQEIAQKDRDLLVYRSELVKTNQALEAMIGQLQTELRMAGLIQKALSPTELPNIKGVELSSKFVPGTRHGGDYFDIFEHEDRFRFGLVISSASGYAMSSLFLSVLIKLAGQIEARRGLEPHKVLESISRELLGSCQAKDSASLFYSVIDRRSFELSYVSAGGILAYWHNAEKDQVTQLEAHAPALTLGWSQNLETQKISLDPRDRLILVTEGIAQAVNLEGEPYGAGRVLSSILAAPKTGVHEMRNEILYQVEKFSGKTTPLRDQTVLVVEVKDRVIKLAT
jgi:phosphoserine phosphatase RsbU/P